MTKKELLEKRDQVAKEFDHQWHGSPFRNIEAISKSSFDYAVSLMLERDKVLRKALVIISRSGMEGCARSDAKVSLADEALAQVPEWE